MVLVVLRPGEAEPEDDRPEPKLPKNDRRDVVPDAERELESDAPPSLTWLLPPVPRARPNG